MDQITLHCLRKRIGKKAKPTINTYQGKIFTPGINVPGTKYRIQQHTDRLIGHVLGINILLATLDYHVAGYYSSSVVAFYTRT